jgi:hypothetical protein
MGDVVVKKWPLPDMDWSLHKIYYGFSHNKHGNPPYKVWMRDIQPRLLFGLGSKGCWAWDTRGTDVSAGKFYPVIRVPVEEWDHRKGKHSVNVRRYIASMFWDYPEDYVVYRDKARCDIYNCVNPHHFMITYRNNSDFKFGPK